MQTTELKPCPYGTLIKTLECTSPNGKHTKTGREIKQTETKSLSFKLASIFENSDSGSDDSDIDFD